MAVAVITGSAGLIGSEAAEHFAREGLDVVGIDNDLRREFFGAEASTQWSRRRLETSLGSSYRHVDLDIRDREGIDALFASLASRVDLIIHAAAQPSHDWAAGNPFVDFDVNAAGTLNLLEAARRHCPDAVFVFTSTNKVYGDTPNRLPLVELETRWEIASDHVYRNGIDESMSVDTTLHSLFGASKLSADLIVQEYGRYFGMPTVCFRGGTLTGARHSATELHGFLGYVMRCAITRTPYTVFGYKGKQVRDVIHSHDVVLAFDRFFRAPRPAEVYNLGGGRASNISVLEALDLAQEISGNEVSWSYRDENRIGDHIWWIGNMQRFESHYTGWHVTFDVPQILREIYENNVERWTSEASSKPRSN